MRPLILGSALLGGGCVVHTHVDSQASGHVSLEPPPDLQATTVERPKDPGEKGVVVSASVTGGYAWGNFDGARRGGGAVALEANVFRFTRETSHRGWVTPHVLDGATRLAVGGGLRFFGATGEPTRVRAAPIYLELQHLKVDEVFGGHIGLGAAFLPSPSSAGPQISGCLGIPLMLSVCVRGAYLIGSGSDVFLSIGYHAAAEWVGSR